MFGVALPSAACALLRPGERAAYGSLPRLWARLAMLLLLGVARPVASQCSNLCKFAFDSACDDGGPGHAYALRHRRPRCLYRLHRPRHSPRRHRLSRRGRPTQPPIFWRCGGSANRTAPSGDHKPSGAASCTSPGSYGVADGIAGHSAPRSGTASARKGLGHIANGAGRPAGSRAGLAPGERPHIRSLSPTVHGSICGPHSYCSFNQVAFSCIKHAVSV